MLKNKVAIVTGGTRGIGYAIVEKYLANHAVVVLCGSRQETADRAVAALKERDPSWRVEGIAPDLGSYESVKAAFDGVRERHGRIDILVNNAGITKDGLLMKMTEADFDAVLSTNLKGAFHTIRHASRWFLKQRSGKVINISSVSGILGNAGQANYSASKAGVIGLTKSAARELASRGINVNAIAPGLIATDMTEAMPKDAREKMEASIPLQRMGEPKDIADMTVFLASDKAKYITGQVFAVDGGMSI